MSGGGELIKARRAARLLGVKRPTIRDIARAAGVSPGAVSFALNGQRGVSEDTRKRIRAAADELGWVPSAAARALSANQAQAVGLVVTRPTDSLTGEGFYLRFIAGIERELIGQSKSLVLQLVSTVAEEAQIYQTWWSGQRVDGVILTDVRQDDSRPEQLRSLNLPAVLVGAPEGFTHDTLSTVTTADGEAMETVVRHLRSQGRRRIAYVAGISSLLHVQARTDAFHASAQAAGVESDSVLSTDFTEDAGTKSTLDLLSGTGGPGKPDAIIYDNELLALGGLMAINSLGLAVPEIAMVSFEDSPVCRVLNPALTSLRRDPAELGTAAASLLLDSLQTGEPGHRSTPAPKLVVRGSTAS